VFKLSIEDDEGKTTVVPLTRDEMTIGRLEGNTIRLTERNVSRRHARLSRQNGAIYIEDLASFTGVRVNGAKIVSATPLREGDEVQIGDYRIALRGEQPAIADRPTMPTMPAVNSALGPMGPMATVGGAVAIPGRASVAAMAAQPAAQVAPATAPRSRTKTSPPQPVAAVPEAAIVVEPVEAQPTIPLRALTEQSAERAAETGPPARLVVLTTDLAGFEVRLDKPSLVIGRTTENDAVLNHRSISRHHAKIVREGDRYTIVDLQSANGVRVNGEDYERIEMNSGDVVELGHVKLRFVAPQEQFVFDGRAMGIQRRIPAPLIAVGGGALAAMALLALFLHRGSRAPETTEPVAASPPPAPAQAAPVAPTPAPPRVAPAAPPATAAGLLAATRQAMAAEDWNGAQADLGQIDPATADPGARREAAMLARKIDVERQGATLYAQFDEAASAKDYAAAVTGYARIPVESVYRKRAQPRYEEARGMVVAEHTSAAEKARAEGRCADMRVEASQVLRLDPKNAAVRELARTCRARPEAPVVVAAAGRPAARSRQLASTTTVERPEPTRRSEAARADQSEPIPAAPAEAEDAETLMKQAREAWLRQQCGAAMELSRRALRAKPGWTDAYQILAVCSCSLKDAEAAEHAYARLDDRNRSLVHAVCQKNGISVGQ